LVGDGIAVGGGIGVAVGVLVGDGVLVGGGVLVAVAVLVGVEVTVGVAVLVAVGVAVGVSVGVGVKVWVGVGVMVGRWAIVAVAVGSARALSKPVTKLAIICGVGVAVGRRRVGVDFGQLRFVLLRLALSVDKAVGEGGPAVDGREALSAGGKVGAADCASTTGATGVGEGRGVAEGGGTLLPGKAARASNVSVDEVGFGAVGRGLSTAASGGNSARRTMRGVAVGSLSVRRVFRLEARVQAEPVNQKIISKPSKSRGGWRMINPRRLQWAGRSPHQAG